MKIDEAALLAAKRKAEECGWTFTTIQDRRNLEGIIRAYIAALPAEPEIEGVRVKILVAVSERGEWFAHSFSDGTREDFEEVICMSYDEPQFRWIEATVPPYEPPAEPVVEGRACGE